MSESPPERRSFTVPGWVKAAVGIVISVALLVWAAWGVDFSKAAEALEHVDYGLYAVSMSCYLGTVAVRALIVQALLGKTVTYKSAFLNLILGYFANNVLPLKIGELVRTGLITREAGLSFWTGLSALIIERSMDLAMVLIIAVSMSFFLPLPPEIVIPVASVGCALLVGYTMAVAFAILHSRRRERLVTLIEKLPASISSKVIRTLDQFATGLKGLGTPLGFIKAVSFVILFWVVAMTGWYLRLSAFGLAETPVVAPFTVVVVGFGVSVPSAPSYAGVMHGCIVFALDTLGIESDLAFPFAVFLHAVDFVFMGILGLSVMTAKSLNFAKLKQAATSTENDGGPK